MSRDNFFEQEQFVLSHDLVTLLQWLMTYCDKELSTLIMQAYIQGLEDQDGPQNDLNGPDMQQVVMTFFQSLEEKLHTIHNSSQTPKVIDHMILKTLDHIDPKKIDYNTIKSTVIATNGKLSSKNKHTDTKKLFLKELLKNWNPIDTHSKKMMN